MKGKSLLALVVAASPFDVALAQDNAAYAQLEEVVVTARKRAESLQETPVAVTALGADLINELGMDNLGDLQKAVPGLDVQEGNKSGGFFIRGVGQRNPADLRTEPGVGVYVDGIFIPRPDIQITDTVNVESIQVLRGPQGTLFGKNTAGGAVLVTTKKPTEEFEAAIDLNVGNYNKQDSRVSISGPLFGGVNAGIVLSNRLRDGYMEDVNNGRGYGDIDRQTAIAQMTWLVTDSLSADWLGFWSKQAENGAPRNCFIAEPAAAVQELATLSDPSLLNQSVATLDTAQNFSDHCAASSELYDKDKVSMDIDGVVFEMENMLTGLTLNYEWDEVTLKSVSAYSHQTGINTNTDGDGAPYFSVENKRHVKQFMGFYGIQFDDQSRDFYSQELQFQGDAFSQRMNYTVGAYYSKELIDNDLNGHIIDRYGVLLPNGFPGSAGAVVKPTLGYFDNQSWALFGQLNYDLGDYTKLTLGARYTEETKEVDLKAWTVFDEGSESSGLHGIGSVDLVNTPESYIQQIVTGSLPTLQLRTLADQNENNTWERLSPMLSVSFITPEMWLENTSIESMLTYISLSEGFKAGGFQAEFDSISSFDEEVVTTTEVGVKFESFDSRVRLNLSAYQSNYDDIQIRTTVTNGLSAVVKLVNAGKATMEGVEFELTLLPAANWLVTVGGNYIDASYDTFMVQSRVGGPSDVDRSNEDFAFVPKTTFNARIQYSLPTKLGDFVSSVSTYYRDSIFIGIGTGSADYSQAYLDSYQTWDARISFLPATFDERMEISFWGKNILDEEYVGNGHAEVKNLGGVLYTKGMPSTYGAQINYAF